ncbi:MAG: Coenzyme F420 hydrogenase/dehydrogenase, beta subunit C-terminal domain [Armatimonadota bacterium]
MANEIEQKIREEAKRLLESGEVTLVIGWKAGSMPFKTTPAFVRSADEVDRLVWNPACTNNLAVYLPQVAKRAKVAVVAKPCDSRSIVTLIQEKQVPRENVKIIGVTCSGIVDDASLKAAKIRLQDVHGLDWDGESILIGTPAGKAKLPITDAVREGCKTCTVHAPVMSDVAFGDAPEVNAAPVEPMEGSFEEKRAFWAKQFERCIRCYACRQVCPACYCNKCFADRPDTKWTSKKADASEAWMFHMGRAMHLAGRCIGCGECERACPMELPIMKLNREVALHVQEMYDYTPGMDPEADPVLGHWEPEDVDPNGHH